MHLLLPPPAAPPTGLGVFMVAFPFVVVIALLLGSRLVMLPRVRALLARLRTALDAAREAWTGEGDPVDDQPPPYPGVAWPRFRHAEHVEDTYHRFDGVSTVSLHLDVGDGLHCNVGIRFRGYTMSRARLHAARAAVWFSAADAPPGRWATVGAWRAAFARGEWGVVAPPRARAPDPGESSANLLLDAPLVFLLEDRQRLAAIDERPARASFRRLRLRDVRRLIDADRVEVSVQGHVVLLDATHQEALREFLWRVERPERRTRIPYPDRDDPGGGLGVDAPQGPPADARPRGANV